MGAGPVDEELELYEEFSDEEFSYEELSDEELSGEELSDEELLLESINKISLAPSTRPN